MLRIFAMPKTCRSSSHRQLDLSAQSLSGAHMQARSACPVGGAAALRKFSPASLLLRLGVARGLSWLGRGASGAASRPPPASRAALERRVLESMTIVIDCHRFYYKREQPQAALPALMDHRDVKAKSAEALVGRVDE